MKKKMLIACSALLVASSVALGINATNKSENPCPNTDDCVCCPFTPDCQPGDSPCTCPVGCEQ